MLTPFTQGWLETALEHRRESLADPHVDHLGSEEDRDALRRQCAFKLHVLQTVQPPFCDPYNPRQRGLIMEALREFVAERDESIDDPRIFASRADYRGAMKDRKRRLAEIEAHLMEGVTPR